MTYQFGINSQVQPWLTFVQEGTLLHLLRKGTKPVSLLMFMKRHFFSLDV